MDLDEIAFVFKILLNAAVVNPVVVFCPNDLQIFFVDKLGERLAASMTSQTYDHLLFFWPTLERE